MKILLREFANRQKMMLQSLMKYFPDPDDVIGSDYDEYRKLLNDPHLFAVVQQRKGQIAQMGWEITNYADLDPIHDEILSLMRRLELPKIINEILNCLLLGYSVLEINWIKKKNRIIPIDIKEKPQEWFGFDKNNDLKLIKRDGELVDLPAMKFILNQNSATYNNPYGEKLLKKVYWIVNAKDIALEMWQKLAERYGMPQLVGRYPSTASIDEINQLLENLETMVEDNITVMSENNTIEWQESDKYNVGDTFEKLLTYYNTEISKAILTVTLTTDVAKSGAYKAAEVHKEMFEYVGLYDKKMCEKAINEMLRYYMLINHGTDENPPRIKLEKKEKIVETSIDRDKKLKDMGVEFTEEYFMKKYNLERGDFVLKEKVV